jgi:hypothetical protein
MSIAANTELRLVNGPTSDEGRVEVKHNGIWGTICCNGFVVHSADVMCKSLGFKGHVVNEISDLFPLNNVLSVGN